MLPQAYIGHGMPHRTRMKIPARRGDHDYFRQLEAALGAHPGVAHVEVNAQTASLLLRHDAPLDEIGAFAEGQELFALVEEIPALAPLSHFLLEAAQGADRELRRISGGRLDIREAGVLLLLAMALYQWWRGHLLGPASTLAWSAVGMLVAASRQLSEEAYPNDRKGLNTLPPA